MVLPKGFCLVSSVSNDKTDFKSAEIKHHGSVSMGQYLSELIHAPLALGQPHPQQKKHLAQYLSFSPQLFGFFFFKYMVSSQKCLHALVSICAIYEIRSVGKK